jgi:hypothetical protein
MILCNDSPDEKSGVAIRTGVHNEIVICGESHFDRGYIVMNKPDALVDVNKATENRWEIIFKIKSTTQNTACSIRHFKSYRYHVGSAFSTSLIQETAMSRRTEIYLLIRETHLVTAQLLLMVHDMQCRILQQRKAAS